MRIFGLRDKIDPSRESIGNCKGFLPAYGSFSTSIFCRMCTSSAVCCFRSTLGYDFDTFAASGEPTVWVLLWKTRSRPIGVRVCPVAQSDFFSTAFEAWTMVVFWKEDSGRQLRLITHENEGGDETSSPSPPRFTFFDDPDVPLNPPETPSAPPGPPDLPGLPPGLPPAPPPAGGRGRARAENLSRGRSRPRSQSQVPQLKPIPTSDDDDDQSLQDDRMRENGNGPNRVIEYILTHKRHKFNQWLSKILLLNLMKKDPGSSGGQQKSRSRERVPVHVPPSADEESAAVEPQCRVSDRSRSPQRKETPQRQKGKKTTAEVKKLSDLPKAKKYKPTDSDEDDVPQKRTWNFFKQSASSTCATSPSRCQKRKYSGWTDPLNYHSTRFIDQYNLDQFTKNIDQYQF